MNANRVLGPILLFMIFIASAIVAVSEIATEWIISVFEQKIKKETEKNA